MKVCVTGGSGFIGGYFVDDLTRAGHEVVILDLIDPDHTQHGLSGEQIARVEFIKGDIRNPQKADEALAGCDMLLNLAAAHHDFGIEYDTYFDVNERGSQILCDAMDNHGVKRACFYSTVAVYGDAPEPREETTPPAPESPYGKSKLAGEKVFEAWVSKGDGRRCLVIRPTVTFGIHNFANMYSLIRQVNSGKFVRVGGGTNIKSLSYVENIVDATQYLWDRDDLEPFDVFNYIDKPDLTSRGISETVYEALGKKPLPIAVPMWFALLGALPFDMVIALTGKNLPISGPRVKKLFAAQTKFEADKLLAKGYTPKVPLKEGIRRMVNWYLEEGKDQSAEWHQPPAEPVLA